MATRSKATTSQSRSKAPRTRVRAEQVTDPTAVSAVNVRSYGSPRHWSELVLRVAMLGVSLGSVAQMLGYSDLGHALMAIGGACGVNAHIRGD